MELIETGKIVNTHGVKGELKVVPWADDPTVFQNFKTVTIDNTPYSVRSVRFQGQNVLLKLDGINDMTAAEGLKNKIIFANRDDFDLPDGTYFIQDLIGLTVVEDETDKELGRITEVFSTGSNDVYEITGTDNVKRYIPAIKDCVKATDMDAKQMRIHVMEGLFDE
ncbi:MAG: 16S rRNA processing protein RimM [Clostridia bacterium]|nr:16S rRNA processing protein RimM [Clostridia bacterium]